MMKLPCFKREIPIDELIKINNKIIKEFNRRSKESNIFRLNDLNTKILANIKILIDNNDLDKGIAKAVQIPFEFIESSVVKDDLKILKRILKENNSKLRKLKELIHKT